MTVIKKVKDSIFRRPGRMTREEYMKKLLSKGLHQDGTPVLDPTPLAPPIGYKKQPSMVELVRDMVRSNALSEAAIRSGLESFEEAEDFDIGDDLELMRSPWENEFDPPLSEVLAAGKAEIEKNLKEARKAARERDNPPVPKNSPKEAEKPPTDGPNENDE